MRDGVQQKTTREAILDATDRLLGRYGYKKMTIDDLAQEVSIGKGSVYLHFSSKEDIVLSHIDRIIERLKHSLNSIASKADPAADRLRDMLVERVLFRFDSVQHYTQSLNELLSQVRPSLLERRKVYFHEESRIFATVIEQGQASGELGDGDTLELAGAMLSATNSLLPFSLSAVELGERTEIESKARAIAALVMRGLLSRN